ncbi:hypothetical protein DFJ74DRAFT_401767 [Hyaloraphidium curvatum]|nr:hypothetical protein DFJ74DRAFT_401767 [Hyaloraphidium curvatum]
MRERKKLVCSSTEVASEGGGTDVFVSPRGNLCPPPRALHGERSPATRLCEAIMSAPSSSPEAAAAASGAVPAASPTEGTVRRYDADAESGSGGSVGSTAVQRDEATDKDDVQLVETGKAASPAEGGDDQVAGSGEAQAATTKAEPPNPPHWRTNIGLLILAWTLGCESACSYPRGANSSAFRLPLLSPLFSIPKIRSSSCTLLARWQSPRRWRGRTLRPCRRPSSSSARCFRPCHWPYSAKRRASSSPTLSGPLAGSLGALFASSRL